MTYKQKDRINEKRIVDPFLISGIGSRIGDISENFGTKKELAEAAGISSAQLYRIIKGDSQPTIGPLVAMAEATGVYLEWLATGRGPKFRDRDNEVYQVNEEMPIYPSNTKEQQDMVNDITAIKELDNRLIDLDLTIDETFTDIESEFSEIPGLKSSLKIAYKFIKRELKFLEKTIDKLTTQKKRNILNNKLNDK